MKRVGRIDRQPRYRRPCALAVLGVALFAVVTGARLGGASVVRYVDDLATAGAAVTAAVFCVRSAVRRPERLRAFWWLLAAACAAWALGELIWALYDLVLGSSVPVPSWADAAYLAAIPLVAAALLAHPAMRGRGIGKLRSVLDGLVLAGAVFFLGWTLLLAPLRHTPGIGGLGRAVTIAYPLGDVVVVLLVVLVIRGLNDAGRVDLWFLLGGLLSITLSDSVFGYLVQVRHYSTGNLIDAGWFAGYLAIALGAHFARSDARTSAPSVARRLSSAAVVAPFVPLLVALSFAAVRVHLGYRLDDVGLAVAFALVTVFLIRQLVLLVDVVWHPGFEQEPVPQRLLDALGWPSGPTTP